MKRVALLFVFGFSLGLYAQDQKPPATLRGVLQEELKTTHDKENWFVPASNAVEGLTAEQARWTPPGGGHSVGQLAYHLWFWDSRSLATFKGQKSPAFSGNNDETFNNFDAAQWDDLVKKLNQVLTDWDNAVASADDATLAANAMLIANVATHNAYHIGQILYVRKLEGAWDPSKGVR
ncbi:MAG TPA: DinB family protein [Terracidiphilus sp.]|jgi:uncharacterized damage-inducible protein DinB|nr:DinB family protein [Terracidiphilus sp.]